ncbi:MAG TPA: DUF4235 domain-containing protein [Nocardioidaceae bacterium]
MASGSKVWSAMALASTVGAGIAARKAMTTSWKVATGKEPPANPADPDVSIGEAVAWAVISGVAIGVARMLASRSAATYYRRSTGHLPPNLQSAAS